MAKEEDVGSALTLKRNTTSTTSTKAADENKQLDGQPVSVSKLRESSRRRKCCSRNPRNKPLLFQSRPPRVPILPPPPPPSRTLNQLTMRFLFEKRLQKSDVSPAGRIVIPKKDAEMYLPALEAKDGFWMHLDDMDFMQVWSIKFRCWPNNTSRMYVFENTRNFIAGHGLAYGDFIMVFKDDETGSYLIRAKRSVVPDNNMAVRTPAVEELFCTRTQLYYGDTSYMHDTSHMYHPPPSTVHDTPASFESINFTLFG